MTPRSTAVAKKGAPTPRAACHARSRRDAVTPEQPISFGTMRHGIPVTSTNTIAVNAARSLTRGRPVRGHGRSGNAGLGDLRDRGGCGARTRGCVRSGDLLKRAAAFFAMRLRRHAEALRELAGRAALAQQLDRLTPGTPAGTQVGFGARRTPSFRGRTGKAPGVRETGPLQWPATFAPLHGGLTPASLSVEFASRIEQDADGLGAVEVRPPPHGCSREPAALACRDVALDVVVLARHLESERARATRGARPAGLAPSCAPAARSRASPQECPVAPPVGHSAVATAFARRPTHASRAPGGRDRAGPGPPRGCTRRGVAQSW